MNNRRDFLKTSVALGAGVVATSLTGCASDKKEAKAIIPKGIYYSKEEQGRWKGKAGSHAPVITVEGKKVTVETKHGMSEGHYIVKHTLLNAEGEVLGEMVFTPKDKAISTYELKKVPTSLVATSFCNLHDLWVSEYKA